MMINDERDRMVIIVYVSEKEGRINWEPPNDKPIKEGWIINNKKSNIAHSDPIQHLGGGTIMDTSIT
jgi:hypothetical protein